MGVLLGWISVLGAVICFGSFAVPIKFPSVQEAKVHPFVFQTYKSFWVFVTAWITLTFTDFSFSWWGCVSAMFWVPAGAAYVMAVDRIGIGITQAIVSSLVITVSVVWGLLFFGEAVSNIFLALIAFGLLAGGVSTMAYFSVPDANQKQLQALSVSESNDEESQASPMHRSTSNSNENLFSPLLNDDGADCSDETAPRNVSFSANDQVEYHTSDGLWQRAVVNMVGRDEELVPYYTITLENGVEKGTVKERLRPFSTKQRVYNGDAEEKKEEEFNERASTTPVFEKHQIVEYRNRDGTWEDARIEAISYDEEMWVYYTITILSSGIEKGTVPEKLRSLHREEEENLAGIMGDNSRFIDENVDTVKQDNRKKSGLVGVGAACFNGIWGGSVMVPLKIAGRNGASTGGIEFVLSFGIGVALVTTLGWIILGIHSHLTHQPLPSLQLKVLAIPGSIAGILWSIGNFCSMYAVIALGEAVGYSSCQAAMMISGLWGLFYFGEAPRGKAQWLFGALATTTGIILLSNAK